VPLADGLNRNTPNKNIQHYNMGRADASHVEADARRSP